MDIFVVNYSFGDNNGGGENTQAFIISNDSVFSDV